ncbi:MAG: DUF4852 domain-containing protein [Alphaproteobacteria bacterium]|nr:DUF4852 domain-containing protein [Alphaproteobacteria bacterium]
MRRLFSLFVFALCLMQASNTHAADEYLQATPSALVQTLLRFGALDINNDVIIDDYAKIVECDLFGVFREDDFKWNKIREGLRSKIRSEAVTYPSTYTIRGYVKLDRYDFDTRMFKINSDSPILGVNAFRLMDIPQKSCNENLKVVPMQYVAVIENRVNIPGFIMSESDAEALLGRLLKENNHSRQILAKFNLRVLDVPKVKIDFSLISSWYDKTRYVGKAQGINLSAKLDSIEFFEDEAMKRRLFVYRP